jgi:hypothetical protein
MSQMLRAMNCPLEFRARGAFRSQFEAEFAWISVRVFRQAEPFMSISTHRLPSGRPAVHESLEQRIVVSYHFAGLARDEVPAYLSERL